MLPTTTDEILGEDTSDNETSGGPADDPLADASVTVAGGGYYQHHSGSSSSDDSGGSDTSHDTTSGESYDFSDHIKSNSYTPDSSGSDDSGSSSSSSDSGGSSDSGSSSGSSSSSSSDEEHDSLDGSDTTMMEYYEANSPWENDDIPLVPPEERIGWSDADTARANAPGGFDEGEDLIANNPNYSAEDFDEDGDYIGEGEFDSEFNPTLPDTSDVEDDSSSSTDTDDLPTTTDEILGEDTSDNETSGGPPDDPLADASVTVAENDSSLPGSEYGFVPDFDELYSGESDSNESAGLGIEGIESKHLALAGVAVGAGLVYMRG